MYGLPANTQLDFLMGKTLIQVCFGKHDLILNFHERISISTQSSIGLELESGELGRHTAYEEACRELLGFLSRDVVVVHWTHDGTLSLTFEGGGKVQFYDDSGDFESYTINGPEALIVV